MLEDIIVFDNGGKTQDRYTVVIGSDVYGMSEDPTHPQFGFNQYSGDVSELIEVSDALDGKRSDILGDRVEVLKLPFNIRMAISRRVTNTN